MCILTWAIHKQIAGRGLKPWERVVTIAHLFVLAVVLLAFDWD